MEKAKGMKKAKRMNKAKGEHGSNSIDMISKLPQPILQKILYSLTEEEAVRTSVLSKSWRHIWCTRPNLRFSDETFKGSKQYFLSVVDTAFQRYLDQRLCLEEFHLSITPLGKVFSVGQSIWFLEKWIPLLTTMGVKEFHLSILAEQSVRVVMIFPLVVFKAESLKLLRLYNCKLDKNPENILCVRLQVLCLRKVSIDIEVFDKIITCCPLLTTMSFEECTFEECTELKPIKLEKKLHKYLKHFTVVNVESIRDECHIEIDAPTLESLEKIEIYGCKIRFHGHKFSNLNTLSLDRVEISINSIEQSQLVIDAPNIEYFKYSGYIIPSISSAPTCGTSKLKLYTHSEDVDDADSWFLRLSKLLQALRRSEISLSIFHISSIFHRSRNNVLIEEDVLVQDIISAGNRPVVVDHLESSHISFLDGLFCICRPRNIYSSWFLQGVRNKERKKMEKKELREFFCKIQMMRESGNQEIWQDLEDLTIEGFDESRREWQPLHITKLSKSALRDFKVRLQWSDQDCES